VAETKTLKRIKCSKVQRFKDKNKEDGRWKKKD
jgi:hypothetical protein